MTKYFKLLGVALIAMSMALVSCEEPTEGNDPGTENPDPGTGGGGGGTPDVAAGTMTTVFGEQTTTFTQPMGIYYANYGAVQIAAINGESLPMIDFAIMGDVAGTYQGELVQDLGFGEQVAWCYYYDAKAWNLDGEQVGDWWAKTVTVNVTAIDLTALTVSANVNAVMFELESIMVPGEGDYEGYMMITYEMLPQATTKSMTAVANTVSMEAAKGAFKK